MNPDLAKVFQNVFSSHPPLQSAVQPALISHSDVKTGNASTKWTQSATEHGIVRMDPTRTSVVHHKQHLWLSFIADTMLSPPRLFVAQKWIPKNNKPHMHFSGPTSSNKPKWLSSLQTVGGACSRRRVSWVARMQRRASSPGRSASTSKALATCAERPSLVLAGWSLLPTVCKMMAGQGNNITSSHWPLEVAVFLSGVTKWVGAWGRCNTP